MRELLARTDRADKLTKRYVRNEIRRAAIPLRDEWDRRVYDLNPKSADFRIYVRRVGVVAVEQPLRKTTGNRPDWGKTQMRVGLAAKDDTADEVLGRFGEALDRIAMTI